MIGWAFGSKRRNVGSRTSSGMFGIPAFTFSRTSCSARLMSIPVLNERMTEPKPSLACEVMWSSPSSVLTASSIGLTTWSATLSGPAPG